jgi:hypothetical protein
MHSSIGILLRSAQSSGIAQPDQGRAKNRQQRYVNHGESDSPLSDACEVLQVPHASGVTAPTYTLFSIFHPVIREPTSCLGPAATPVSTSDKHVNLLANAQPRYKRCWSVSPDALVKKVARYQRLGTVRLLGNRLVTKTPIVGKRRSTLLAVFSMVGAGAWPTLSCTWRSSAPEVEVSARPWKSGWVYPAPPGYCGGYVSVLACNEAPSYDHCFSGSCSAQGWANLDSGLPLPGLNQAWRLHVNSRAFATSDKRDIQPLALDFRSRKVRTIV